MPEFINNTLRSKNREKLQAIILDVFKHLTQTEVINRLDLANIARANVNEMKDVWHHPDTSTTALDCGRHPGWSSSDT